MQLNDYIAERLAQLEWLQNDLASTDKTWKQESNLHCNLR